MNANITKLTAIAAKKERRIIGLMSGTSLDGLDMAVCRIKNSGFDTEVITEHFETISYTAAFKEELHELCFKENVSLQKLTLLHKSLALYYADAVNSLLANRKINSEDVDLIASHGQTIFHAPQSLHQMETGNATLQVGDGDLIAVKTGIITISDFRQKHIAGGGEGAPLAAYGDLLLFKKRDQNVVMLNIGGISNFTFIPASGAILSSDIGPGNTLMNQWVKAHYPGKEMDEHAAIALSGKINAAFLEALKEDVFFKKPFPKTTGPELFNAAFVQRALAKSNTQDLPPEDVLATLNKFTADLICDALNSFGKGNACKIYISGGGIHNPLLVQHLKEGLKGFTFHSTEEKHINPDAKEAILFALLANECVAGNADTFKGLSDKMPAVSMGKISFPY
jgi:anhydro-N-acetylmuramic acid kinase